MGDTSSDPAATKKSGFNAPGLGLLAVAIVAMVIALASLTSGHSAAGVAATGVSAVAFFAGGGWLFVAHRHLREQEARRRARHPDAGAQPTTS